MIAYTTGEPRLGGGHIEGFWEGAGETCIDWSDTSEPFWTTTSNPVAGHCDVAVVFGPP